LGAGDESALGRADVASTGLSGLAASWERSRRHGLRRQDRALFNDVVTATVSRRVAEEHRSLLTHANPEMQRLYASLGSARWLALCVNTAGQIVCHAGQRSAAPREIQVLMQPGRRLLEAELGTTAPGCVLEEGRPVVVVRGEHNLHELEHLFCASAPIMAPDGQLAGALDITGCDVRALPLASDMVGFAVRRIENSMLAELANCTLLHFHRDERLLGTPFEALLAVDGDGTIRGANRMACQLLSLREDNGVGVALASVFECGLVNLMRRSRSHAGRPVPVQGDDGSYTYVNVSSAADVRRAGLRSAASHPLATSSTAPSPERDLIVEDARLIASFGNAVRIARSGLPVIVEGETGTGKEMVARALHGELRPHGPFLAINCSAIPEGLIETELFGYAEGAFTGGRKGGSVGKIERANGGTLLLDEIGDMSLALQSRLLRVLQERVVTRIGDDGEVPVDLLVISATHRQLERLVADGRFREDLYYRLNGYTLSLPRLRDRGDRRVLIERLCARWRAEPGHPAAQVVPEVMTDAAREVLERYEWPGNIRQLEQTLRAVLALRTPGRPIDVEDLPETVRCGPASPASRTRDDTPQRQSLADLELQAIRNALSAHAGNLSAVARALGISRSALYAKLERYGLRTRSTTD
jgi:transcriptional regulator of acetoin/glycerol metabolism